MLPVSIVIGHPGRIVIRNTIPVIKLVNALRGDVKAMSNGLGVIDGGLLGVVEVGVMPVKA